MLDWIQQDWQLSKRLGGNYRVRLLRLIDMLTEGDYERAERVVKQGYENGNHHMTIRGDELIQLSKHSVEFQLRSVPTRQFTDYVDSGDQADPACAVFAKHIAAVMARQPHVMHMAVTAASTTLTAGRMRAIAETAGVRLLHVSCQPNEPELWRVILRELLVASMRDPDTNWNNLKGAVAFADGKAALEPAVADCSASVLREVATRGPVVVAVQDAHLLGKGMASLLDRVVDRIQGQPIGFVLVDGKDTKKSGASG